MKYTMLIASLLALSLSACVSRSYEKETVVNPAPKTVVVPGPSTPGETTVIIPR